MRRVHHPKFVEAYETFRTHWKWFMAKQAAGEVSIPDTKEMMATARAFLRRWQGKTRLA